MKNRAFVINLPLLESIPPFEEKGQQTLLEKGFGDAVRDAVMAMAEESGAQLFDIEKVSCRYSEWETKPKAKKE